MSQSCRPGAMSATSVLGLALLGKLVDLMLTIRAEDLTTCSLELSVFGVVSWQPMPLTQRSLRPLPHTMVWRVLFCPGRHRLAAMAPKLLWLGKNLWHVSCCLPQAMIHGVLENCFVPGPRGHFIGGSPISLPIELLPLALDSLLLVLTPSAACHRYSLGSPARCPSLERTGYTLWLRVRPRLGGRCVGE